MPKWPLAVGISCRQTACRRRNLVARYLLERTAERYGLAINWEPKPLGKELDWNGSGMHANFSNGVMRESGDEAGSPRSVRNSARTLNVTSASTAPTMISA